MAKKYIIEGGYPLKGKITPNGNKNAALPILAATILTDEEVILRNVPNIEDVNIMIKILGELGKKIEKIDEQTLNAEICDGLFERDYAGIAERINAYRQEHGRRKRKKRKRRRSVA